MPSITVSPPSIGLEAYFSFKEPVLSFIQSKLNTNETSIKLKVIGVNNLRGLLEAELRDPFVDTYNPMGITVEEYKADVLNDVPLFVLSYRGIDGKPIYVKAPLNYISEYSNTLDILYTNRLIVMDMNKLPSTLDTVVLFDELSDMVFDRFGVRPMFKEVSIGEPEKVQREEHELRETVRKQAITVFKSSRTNLAELTLKYNELVSRLNDLNIILS